MQILTKEEAITEHRKMWNWIAEECIKRKRRVTKLEYFKSNCIINIPYNKCYCCEFAYNNAWKTNTKITDRSDICKCCPLIWKYGKCVMDGLGEYDEWVRTLLKDDFKAEAEIARKIANLPERINDYE